MKFYSCLLLLSFLNMAVMAQDLMPGDAKDAKEALMLENAANMPLDALPNVFEGNIGVAVADIVGIDPQADRSIPASVPKNKIGNGGKPCIEESVTYPDGASTKFVGLQCLNGTHYDAVDFICADGAIRDIDTVRACPVFDAPYCVQCGGRSFGAALCLSKPDVPDYCDTFLPVAASAVLKAGNSTGTGKMMMMMKKNGLGATNTTTTRALQQEASVPARRFRGSSR